jgi:hypothetical protein
MSEVINVFVAEVPPATVVDNPPEIGNLAENWDCSLFWQFVQNSL